MGVEVVKNFIKMRERSFMEEMKSNKKRDSASGSKRNNRSSTRF